MTHGIGSSYRSEWRQFNIGMPQLCSESLWSNRAHLPVVPAQALIVPDIDNRDDMILPDA